jgi:hypothetical protein
MVYTNAHKCGQPQNSIEFDLFRLSKSKAVVDISPNTLRSYNRDGLPFYKQGKAVFVSRTELDRFIRRDTGGSR